MVGVNMVVHDAICERFEGTMLEPCLFKPCFHVAGNGATAKVMIFDRLGKKVRPGTFGMIKSRLTGVPKKSLSKTFSLQ